jgi:predicted transcriptional regulator
MKLKDIVEIIDGNIICGEDRMYDEYIAGFASDLMSDVLTLQTTNFLLITGLVNIQTIRTAEMADINCIILARKKKALPDFIELASQNNMTLIECPYSMFKTCGLLFKAGLKAVY